jgi:hypothetical protein
MIMDYLLLTAKVLPNYVPLASFECRRKVLEFTVKEYT